MDNDFILLEHGNNPEYSEEYFERLFATKALKVNPDIVNNPFIFEKLCYALNGISSDFYNIEPATILLISKAVKTIEEILNKDIEFNYEIKWYIAYSAFEEGWVKLPSILSFAQSELDELNADFENDINIEELQKLKHEAVEKYLNEKI